jgi:hypothetical protein
MTLPDFIEIDGLKIFDRVPFEIAFIYEYSSNDEQRFLKVEYADFEFYTEFWNYRQFWDKFESGQYYGEDLNILNDNLLKPYMKSFSLGFYEGYKVFDIELQRRTAIFNSDAQTIANKVFETIITPIPGLCISAGHRIDNKRIKVIKHDLWLQSGKEMGAYYKAWFYVINNPRNFTQLFKTHEQFISFYKSSLEYWKNKTGGEGLYDGLKTVLSSIADVKISKINAVDNSTLKHRHHAIIYKYKVDAKYIPNVFSAKEIEMEFGAKRKQAFYTIWNVKGKNYKAPTENELRIVIANLNEFPLAQKAATNDLDEIIKKL